MNARARRHFERLKRIAKRRLPDFLLAHRQREQELAIAANRPRPSRRQRHLDRLAERKAQLADVAAQMAANKPEFEA